MAIFMFFIYEDRFSSEFLRFTSKKKVMNLKLFYLIAQFRNINSKIL